MCLSGILEEAEFYNITELIKLVKDRIKERDAKQNQVIVSWYIFYSEREGERGYMDICIWALMCAQK